MTPQELRQEAIDCLAKAFNGEQIDVHVVQAAVSVLLAPLTQDRNAPSDTTWRQVTTRPA